MKSRRIVGLQGVGAAIREERLNQGLTQAQLALKARVSREWLSGVERGERAGAELSKILQLLSALDLDLSLTPRSSRDTAERAPEDEASHSSATANGSRPLTTNEATRQALKKMLQPFEATPLSSLDEQTLERGRHVLALILAEKKAER